MFGGPKMNLSIIPWDTTAQSFYHADLWRMSFQDPVTPIAYGLLKIHDHILFFFILIFTMVSYFLITTYQRFHVGGSNFEHHTAKGAAFDFSTQKPLIKSRMEDLQTYVKSRLYLLSHGTLIEIVWTLFPSVILLLIAVPSFALLYAMDELIDPVLTVKVIGHQ